MESCIAELCAKDGLSFRAVAGSRVLRRLFRKGGYGEVPKSDVTIRNQVLNYGKKIRSWTVERIKTALEDGEKYSLTLDEWTSKSNRRFLNVTMNDKKNTCINLGLVTVGESFTAEQCVLLVKQRLTEFGINLTSDIIASTTDGASVMKKYGRISEIINQLCMAHAIQLAVIDVFYQRKTNPLQAYNSDEDDEEEQQEIVAHSSSNIEEQQPAASEEVETDEEQEGDFEVDPNSGGVYEYRSQSVQTIAEKVRRIVRMFRKSPQKYLVLVQQLQNDRKEIEEIRNKPMLVNLHLILDNRTRWSSLYDMLQRYYELQTSIEKAIIDLRGRQRLSKKQKTAIVTLTEDEKDILRDMVTALGPVKVAVEEICHRDVNLLSFENILTLLMETLTAQGGPEFGLKLRLALRRRIDERRTVWSKVLYTLHHGYGDIQSESDSSSDEAYSGSENPMILPPMKLKKKAQLLLGRVMDFTSYPDSDEDIMEGSSRASRLQVCAASSKTMESPAQSLSLREKMQLARATMKLPKQKVSFAVQLVPECPNSGLFKFIHLTFRFYDRILESNQEWQNRLRNNWQLKSLHFKNLARKQSRVHISRTFTSTFSPFDLQVLRVRECSVWLAYSLQSCDLS